MRFIALLLIAALSGCATYFDAQRQQDGNVLIQYNSEEVRLLELNGKKFPKYEIFSANEMLLPAGMMRVKVQLYWYDPVVRILYESPVIKDICFDAQAGYRYSVWARLLENDWEPFIVTRDHEPEISCP